MHLRCSAVSVFVKSASFPVLSSTAQSGMSEIEYIAGIDTHEMIPFHNNHTRTFNVLHGIESNADLVERLQTKENAQHSTKA
jgi:hypothetical protein